MQHNTYPWRCPVCRRHLTLNDKPFDLVAFQFPTSDEFSDSFAHDSDFFADNFGRFRIIRRSINDFFDHETTRRHWTGDLWVMVTQISPDLHAVELIWRGPSFFGTHICSDAEACLIAQRCREREGYQPYVWLKDYIEQFCGSCAANPGVGDE